MPGALESELCSDVADAKTWTLSGNGITQMWFDLLGELTYLDMGQAFVEQFGRENCQVENANTRATLCGKVYSSTTIQVNLVGQQMMMDL